MRAIGSGDLNALAADRDGRRCRRLRLNVAAWSVRALCAMRPLGLELSILTSRMLDGDARLRSLDRLLPRRRALVAEGLGHDAEHSEDDASVGGKEPAEQSAALTRADALTRCRASCSPR